MKKTILYRGIFLFIILFFSCVVLLMGAEIYFRITGQYPTQYNTYDEKLIWRMKPGQTQSGFDERFLLNINNQGFRGDDFSIEKSPSVKRIMFLGDSYTAGLDYKDEDIYPNQFAAQLSFENEVMNVSVPGWATDQHLCYLKDEGLQYKPDVLILMLSSNDIREAYVRKHVEWKDNELVYNQSRFSYHERLKWWLYNTSHTYNWYNHKENDKFHFISKIWKHYPVQYHIHDDVYWDLPTFLPERIEAVEEAKALSARLLKEINKICRKNSIQLLVTVIPMKEEYSSQFLDLGGIPGSATDFVQGVCKQENIPFLDLYQRLKDTGSPSEHFISWEFHFNKKGHHFVGNELFTFFEAQSEE